MAAQLAELPAPTLVVVDGEAEIIDLARRLWPQTPIGCCWWHLPHGRRKAFYADDDANRHAHPPAGPGRCPTSSPSCYAKPSAPSRPPSKP